MTAILVDSNVLLDIMSDDPAWSGWSANAIEKAAAHSRLVINALIYAEISVRFSQVGDLEAALPKTMFEREAIPFEAGFIAGKAFQTYRQRGGDKRSPLPDFLIGAHAAVAGYQLLTRDPARYRTCFPQVTLITPE